MNDTPDSNASPNGWHSSEANGTSGNNVVTVFYAQNGAGTTAVSDKYTFEFPYDPTAVDPRASYQDAAHAQTFWLVNMLHDLYYILGWNEAAGSAQTDNFGKGGEAGDRVDISIQDLDGWNNGFMTTQRDGIAPIMTLYLFDATDPYRDVAFDNGFVIHEYTHGCKFQVARRCRESFADPISVGQVDRRSRQRPVSPGLGT